jgi:predicted RNA binding protein YcfA (HicA-like mRNA interferase family)
MIPGESGIDPRAAGRAARATPGELHVTAREVIATLQRMGFIVRRQVGSHVRLIHPERPEAHVTVSVHAGRDLSQGNLASILRQAGVTREEFEQARRRHT